MVQNPGTAWLKNSWRLLKKEANKQCSTGDNCSVRHNVMWESDTVEHRILSCSRVKEKHREPEVPEEEVPVVECFDGLVRITSKELASIHSVKCGTFQNACSTRPRVVADVVKSAHMHIVRLMFSRVKGPKRMLTKVQ